MNANAEEEPLSIAYRIPVGDHASGNRS